MRLVFLLTFLFASAAYSSGNDSANSPSPAQTKIARLEESIAKSPANARLYNQLALAFCSRARETADPVFYDRAGAALRKSLELEPSNFEAAKIHVWALLGKHEFQEARDEAERLRKRAPDDVLVYGYLVDANVELGDYKAAEEAAQWMLDLRPGNVPGLTRAAYLRELFGDLEGAIQFMSQAYERTPPQEREDLAWISTQLGHLYLSAGQVESAEQALQQALQHFPDYHYALGQLAKVRKAQTKFDEAVSLERRRYALAPHPENLYQLAEALMQAQRPEEARRLFATFEKQALAEMEKSDNSNRELIFHFARRNPRKALEIARWELKRRQDVYTLDAYAWALYCGGKRAEARRQMKEALAVGIKDPEVVKRATIINRGL